MTGRYTEWEREDLRRQREGSFRRLFQQAGLDAELGIAAFEAFNLWETGKTGDWTSCSLPGGVIAALVAYKAGIAPCNCERAFHNPIPLFGD